MSGGVRPQRLADTPRHVPFRAWATAGAYARGRPVPCVGGAAGASTLRCRGRPSTNAGYQ
ncbi:hypothetical protein GCM10027074_47670 [Streptomyces deserti]